MRIIVTGATGNLGTSTIEALSNDSRVNEIVGVARRKPEIQVNKCTFVAADVARDDLGPLFRGADAVVHLAWQLQPMREVRQLQRTNVDGMRAVLNAVRKEQVKSVVAASSVGAYSPGSKDALVDEVWPTQGISSSMYSRQKVQVERMLEDFEAENSETRVVRMRPALVFKANAAAEIHRLFLGPLVPRFLLHPQRVPLIPDLKDLRFQCVHSLDVGRAFSLAALSDERGAFNVAAEPVLDPVLLSNALGARRVPMPASLLRCAVEAAWHLRLSPIDKGWVDLALQCPLMDTTKVRQRLGFQPVFSAEQALLDLLTGLHEGKGMDTEPLRPSHEATN